MRTLAVLPVKAYGAAKQRLAGDLGTEQGDLAAEMAAGVLRELCAVRGLGGVLVVTCEPQAAALAAELGAEVVPEPELRGHSAAASLGVARAVALGAERVLLAAGDCPLLRAGDVDALLRRHRGSGVVVLADRHGSGTNGLLLAPPTAIEPAFGPGSRARHEARAAARGLPCTVEVVEGFALDVDTAADLAAARAAAP